MAPTLEFGLLGPLMVRCDGVPVPIQRGKQRVLLAFLLLNAGQLVPVGELAETLWGAAAPPSASVTLRNYVKRLRHSLGETGRGRISTYPGGYVISLKTDELDVARFEDHLNAARAAARGGSWDAAAARARAAVLLWRGAPLEDVASELLTAREIPRLSEMRLQALELRIDAELHCGRQGEVIAELGQLARAHPLREHLHAQYSLVPEYGTELVSVTEREDGVDVGLRHADAGDVEHGRYDWVVGCDGSKSRVRQEAGIGFTGQRVGVIGTGSSAIQAWTVDRSWPIASGCSVVSGQPRCPASEACRPGFRHMRRVDLASAVPKSSSAPSRE